MTTATATKKGKGKYAHLSDAEILELAPPTLGRAIIGDELFLLAQEARKRTEGGRIGVAIVGTKDGTKLDQSGRRVDEAPPARANRTPAPPLPKPSAAAVKPKSAVAKMPVLAEEWDGWKRNEMLKIVRTQNLDCKSTATRDELADLLAAAGVAPPESA